MSALPPCFMNNDKGTFGEYTATVRWPIIVQNMVDDLQTELDTLNDINKVQQGQLIKGQLVALRQEIHDGAQLRPFTEEELTIAHAPRSINDRITTTNPKFTWNNAEWLFAEIYLYRRVNAFFKLQPLWRDFDIFNGLKQSTFKASFHGVVELAIRYKNLLPQLQKLDKVKDEEVLNLLFKEFIEISLWGNATDLSLLTNVSVEDIKSIQGAKARAASEAKIVVNDTEKAWRSLLSCAKSKSEVRVDFVLDNSGFELLADLMLVCFLLQTGLVQKCVFHGKDVPYMVSDVMIKDLDILIGDLKDRKFFPSGDATTEESKALDKLADDITGFCKAGKLVIEADPFWTTELDYWNIDASETKYGGAKIYKELQKSDLVIFKGDLNYRKLTGDRKWKRTTKWETAIGPLATNGLTTLSLRTCKADVQVALAEGVDEELSKLWEVDHPGKGSWWSNSGKYAVICFADSKN